MISALAGGQDRIASGGSAAELVRYLAGAAQSTEGHGNVALVSSCRHFVDPVISAHGRAVVLDVNVGKLLSAADSIPGELLVDWLLFHRCFVQPTPYN